MVAEMPSDRDLINSQQEALLGETKRADVAIARAEAAEAERDKFRQRAEGIWNFLGPEGQDALIESGWHP